MKISEIFYTIQGEIDVGVPSVFIRFSGCNLIREGNGCKFCDSIYAEQGTEMSVEEIIKETEKYNCKNIVITGGESMMQKEELKSLADVLYDKKFNVSIETNGTIFDIDILWYMDNINCSPKKQAIDFYVLKELNKLNTRFKFVYENKKDKWWEDVIKEVDIENRKIWIMPEGATREEQLNKSIEVVEYCKEKGFNFAIRAQTLIWNNKKGI